jgi:hypothetical protein
MLTGTKETTMKRVSTKPKKRTVQDVVNAFLSVLDQHVLPATEIRQKLLAISTDEKVCAPEDRNKGELRIFNSNWDIQFTPRGATFEGYLESACQYPTNVPGYAPHDRWCDFTLLRPHIRGALSATCASRFKMSFCRCNHTNRPTQFELNMATQLDMGKIIPVLPFTGCKVKELSLGAGSWTQSSEPNVRYRYPARVICNVFGLFQPLAIPTVIRPYLGTEFNMVWPGQDWPSDEEVAATTERMLSMWIEANVYRLQKIDQSMINVAVAGLDDLAVGRLAFGIRQKSSGKKYHSCDEIAAMRVADKIPSLMLSHPRLQKAIANGVARELNDVC